MSQNIHIIYISIFPSIDLHLDPVVMFAVSASGFVAALSLVRTAFASNQNAAKRVCKIGVLFGAGHRGHELGQLRFDSGLKLARTKGERLGATFLV